MNDTGAVLLLSLLVAALVAGLDANGTVWVRFTHVVDVRLVVSGTLAIGGGITLGHLTRR